VWLDGWDAESPLSPEFVAHLETCDSCRGAMRAYRDALSLATRATAQTAIPLPPRAGTLDARLRSRLRRRAIRRWAPAVLLPAAALLAVALRVAWPGAPVTDGIGVNGPPAAADPARSGATLAVRPGQTVLSGTEGAVVADPRTGRIALGPETRLTFDAWSPEATALRLETGVVQAEVEHRAPGERFEVRTPYVVVRVTGTRFEVTHRPGLDSVVTVQEGEVEVDRPSGELLARLPAGGTIRVERPSSALEPPVPAESPATRQAESGSRTPEDAVARVRLPSPATPLATARTGPAPRPGPPHPPGTEDLLARVRALAADGRTDEALALLSLRDDQPEGRERLLAALGDALWVAGRPEEARATYERALVLWSKAPPEGLFLDLAILVGQRMDRPIEAGSVWRRYLEAWPSGRYAGRALRDLAAIEDTAGRPDAARDLRRRLLTVAPHSPEAASAFARLGRDLLEGPDLDAAARWFAARLDDPDRLVAEAALVGLMRVRLAQDRPREVRSLASEYERRFRAGTRRDEVRRVLDAVPPSP
jgi:Flp pilus assembly protein TadD